MSRVRTIKKLQPPEAESGTEAESDQIKVAVGYARNYLLPQGLAIPLTTANKRRLEALKRRRAEREAHELNTMTELGKSISKLLCVITVKTGEDGKVLGTVTSGMIADQLKTKFDISIDKRKIHLERPIRALGEHEIELRLHPDVTSSLNVCVESSTPVSGVASSSRADEEGGLEAMHQKPGVPPKRAAAGERERPPVNLRNSSAQRVAGSFSFSEAEYYIDLITKQILRIEDNVTKIANSLDRMQVKLGEAAK